VSDTFAGLGLTVLASNAATRTVQLGGPVHAMEAAFQIKPMQFRGTRGDYLTPLLYGAAAGGAAPPGRQGFNDIHAGDNITAHVGGFKSIAGFDAVTGWGSPKGKDLLAALAKVL